MRMQLEILQPFRPVLGAEADDSGGREVVGWIHGPRWRCLWPWLRLLVDRNMHGTIPFETNPEPWPHYYLGIHTAELSHGRSPWFWGVWTWISAYYPLAPDDQIREVLTALGLD